MVPIQALQGFVYCLDEISTPIANGFLHHPLAQTQIDGIHSREGEVIVGYQLIFIIQRQSMQYFGGTHLLANITTAVVVVT